LHTNGGGDEREDDPRLHLCVVNDIRTGLEKPDKNAPPHFNKDTSNTQYRNKK